MGGLDLSYLPKITRVQERREAAAATGICKTMTDLDKP